MALIIHNLHEIIIFSTGRMCATKLHNWSSAIDLNCEKKRTTKKIKTTSSSEDCGEAKIKVQYWPLLIIDGNRKERIEIKKSH